MTNNRFKPTSPQNWPPQPTKKQKNLQENNGDTSIQFNAGGNVNGVNINNNVTNNIMGNPQDREIIHNLKQKVGNLLGMNNPYNQKQNNFTPNTPEKGQEQSNKNVKKEKKEAKKSPPINQKLYDWAKRQNHFSPDELKGWIKRQAGILNIDKNKQDEATDLVLKKLQEEQQKKSNKDEKKVVSERDKMYAEMANDLEAKGKFQGAKNYYEALGKKEKVAEMEEKIKQQNSAEKDQIPAGTFNGSDEIPLDPQGSGAENISSDSKKSEQKMKKLERTDRYFRAREQLLETKKELKSKQERYLEIKEDLEKVLESGPGGLLKNRKYKAEKKQLEKEIDKLAGERAVFLTEALKYRGTDEDVTKVRSEEENAKVFLKRKEKSKAELAYDSLSSKQQKKINREQIITLAEQEIQRLESKGNLSNTEIQQLETLKTEKKKQEKERHVLEKLSYLYKRQNKVVKVLVGTAVFAGAVGGATFTGIPIFGATSLTAGVLGVKAARSLLSMVVGAKVAQKFGGYAEKRIHRLRNELNYDVKKEFGISSIDDINKLFDKKYKDLKSTEKSLTRTKIELGFLTSLLTGAATGIGINEGAELLHSMGKSASISQLLQSTGIGSQPTATINHTSATPGNGVPLGNMNLYDSANGAPLNPAAQNIGTSEPISVDASKLGAIKTFEDLKGKIAEISAGDRTPLQQDLMKHDAVELAKKYGFYDPNNVNESSMIMEGDTFKLTDNGALEYVKANGEIVTLEDGKDFTQAEGHFGDKGGEMFDYQPKEPTQCVVADTRLRKLSEDGEFWSEVMIKDVRAGDKVATMDQITGILTWSMVVDKMVTGKKKIYQIETQTGRTIRTTSQHPYFVRKKYPQPEEISKQKLYRFEIDQSIKIENTNKDSVLAIGNKEQSYSLTISKKIKKELLEKFRNDSKNKGQLKYFNATVFAFGIIELIQKSKIKVHELVIDQEYPGYEKYIETICRFYYPDIQILFGLIGKKSPAHYTAYFTYQGKRKSDFQIDEEKIFKQIKNVLRTSSLQLSKGGQSYYNPTQTFSANIVTNENEKVKSNFAVQDGLWIKVENLKAKEMIAVVYGDQIVWEKINKISVQQEEFVYDIEIQNTRNFIANNIVAHNTYIPEQHVEGRVLDPRPAGQVIGEAHTQATTPKAPVGSHVVSSADGKVSAEVTDIKNTSVDPKTPEQPIGPTVIGEMPQETNSSTQISEMDRLSIINSGEVRPDTFQFLKIGETMIDKNLNISAKRISPNIFFFNKGDVSVGLIQNKDSFGNLTYQITPRINTGITDNLLNNQQKLPEIEDFISKPENNFNSYNGGVDKAFNRAKELLRKTTTTTFNDDYSA